MEMFENKIVNNIIAIINYNQKNYCIYNENGSIDYAVLDADKFEFDIDIKTAEVLNQFYNLIKYNKKYSVFCGNYKLNHNEFEIYQDLRSKLYTFVLKKDNKRYLPSKEDTQMLNSYFNNEQFVFFDENQEKEAKKNNNKPLRFIKKVLQIGGITVVALISATTLTYNLPQNVKNNIDYEIGTVVRRDLTQGNKSYTFDDLKTAIDNNKNISKKDNLFIKSILEDEFEENKEYIDISKLIKKFETLKIQYDKYYTYNEETGEYELTQKESDIVAYYDIFDNAITCIEPAYSKSEIEEKKDEPFGIDEVDKSTYYHELNHVFTISDLDCLISQAAEQMSFLELNDYIRTNTGIFEAISDDMQKTFNTTIFGETINEIFSQEYIDKYYQQTQDKKRNTGYSRQLPYMYCLAEILSTDVLREYKFNDNDSIITEGLLNISNNKSEAYEFMTSLRSLNLYDNLIVRAETNNNIDEYLTKSEISNEEKEDSEEVKQAKQEQKENYKRIHDGFSYFYKAKYNKEMSDDMNMLIYLYNTPILTDEERQKVIEFLNLSPEQSNIKFTAKGYFSETYIETHPYVTITYTDKNLNDKTVTIDDDNRYLENDQDFER